MRFIDWFRDSQRRRKAARQLRALPDEVLADIGVEPERIDAIVRDMVATRPSHHAHTFSPRHGAPVPHIGTWPYPWPR